ncbi:hypothetical protein ACYSNW_03705 [Enterococcus sp. LJL99]
MTYKNNHSQTNKQREEINKTQAKYLNDRSKARSFIRNQASIEDLAELEQLIAERKNVLPQ